MLKLAVVSIAIAMMVSAEPPPQNGGYSPGSGGYHRQQPPQQYQHPQQHSIPYRIKPAGASKLFGWLGSKMAKIPNFLPRFPHFPKYKPHNLPNYQAQVILPQPPKTLYDIKSQGSQQAVIFGPSFSGHNNAANYYSSASAAINYQPQPLIQYQPQQQQHQHQQQFKPVEPNVEVVPSQLLSYEKEVISGGGPASGYYHPAPIASPPLYSTGGKVVDGQEQIPVVPQSNGPDYFNTAYTSDGQQYQTEYSQAQPQQQYEIQNLDDSDNYGANFGNIQVQQSQVSPQIYDASLDLRAVGGPVIDASSQQQQEQSYMDGSAMAGGQETSLSSIISSLANSAGQGSYSVQQPQQQQQNTAYSQLSVASVRPPQHDQQQYQPDVRVTSSYSRVGSSQAQARRSGHELAPGVQLLSQGTNDGNPVFEVVADANSPTYNGHPFDINKLIEMIEPGAQLDAVPQLSEASSENKESYVEAPTAGIMIPQQQETSGTGDLHYSESDPQPSIANLDGTRISSMPFSLIPKDVVDDNDESSSEMSTSFVNVNTNDSSSSLMELMQFFQQTGGKGFVVVEKKGSNLTLTNDTDTLTVDDDDDLTNGPTRLNITSEIIPQLEIQQNINKLSLIDPTYPKKAGYSSLNTKANTSNSFVKLPNNTYLTPTAPSLTSNIILPPTKLHSIPAVVFPTRKAKPYVNIRQPQTGVKTTQKLAFKPKYVLPPPRSTQHPNHNYNATPSTTNSDYPLLGMIPGLSNTETILNPLIDSVAPDFDPELGSGDDYATVDDMIETEGDLAISESQQVKSISITVTPPSHLLSNDSMTTPTTPDNDSASTEKTVTSIPIPGSTQRSKSGKSRPFPVYRGKSNN